MGQRYYSLRCSIGGAGNLNPSITYQWTKNNGTQSQIGADEVLSFSPLRLSDAGRYTCQATVSSPYLNNDITVMRTQDVRLHSEFSYWVIIIINSGRTWTRVIFLQLACMTFFKVVTLSFLMIMMRWYNDLWSETLNVVYTLRHAKFPGYALTGSWTSYQLRIIL